MVESGTIRRVLALNRILQWASAVIVMGIVSYFIAKYTQGTHLIYEEVIACIMVGLWLPTLFLPFMGSYKGYYWPLDLIFTYLWLTAFIFTTQDYNYKRCSLNAPPGERRCSRKWTLEAFTFLTFFFTLTGAILDYMLWDSHRIRGHAWNGHEKHDANRPLGDTGRTA